MEALSSRIHNDWGRWVTAEIVNAEFAPTADHAPIAACRARRRTRSGVRGPVGNVTARAVPFHAEVARGPSRLAVEIGLLVQATTAGNGKLLVHLLPAILRIG